jgi:hypothetical protein
LPWMQDIHFSNSMFSIWTCIGIEHVFEILCYLIIFHLVDYHCSTWFNLGLIFAWETLKMASIFWFIIYNTKHSIMVLWSLGVCCQILCVIHDQIMDDFWWKWGESMNRWTIWTMIVVIFLDYIQM